MHVSPKTCETYRARLKEKLNLSSGRELIQCAILWTCLGGAASGS